MANQVKYGQDLVDAVMTRDARKVRKVLKAGANLDFVQRGDTAIHLAARQGDLDIISDLLRAGDSVNKGNQNGNTPLHFVARDGRDDLVRYLVKKGADINVQNEDGDTPLHASVGYQPMDIIEYYVSIGMDINRQNKNGDTPLHVAVSHSRDESVEALLLSDADVNVMNKQGKKPYQLARREDIADLIKTFDLLKAAKDSGFIMAEGTKLRYKDVERPKYLERVGLTMETMSLDPDPHSLAVFYCRREKYENNTVSFQTEPEEEVVSDVFHFRVRDVIEEISASFSIPVYAEPSDKQQIILKFLAGKGGMQIITDLAKRDEGIFCTVDVALVPETTSVLVVCLCAKGQDQVIGEQAQQISSEVEDNFVMDIPAGAFQPDTVISLKVFDVNEATSGNKEDSKCTLKDEIDDKENIRSKRKLRKRKAKSNLLSDLFQINISGEQPAKNVKMQLPLTEACKNMAASDLQVVRVNEGNSKDVAILPCEPLQEGNIVNFETEHFCVFVMCPTISDIAQIMVDIKNARLRRQEARFFAMIKESDDEEEVSHVLVVECMKSKLSSNRRKYRQKKGFTKQDPKHSPPTLLSPSQEFHIELSGDAIFDEAHGETGQRKLAFSPHRASHQLYRVTLPRYYKNGGKACVHIHTAGKEDTISMSESEIGSQSDLNKAEVATLNIKLPLPPEEDPFGPDVETAFGYESARETTRRKLRSDWWKMADGLWEQWKSVLIQQQVAQQKIYLSKKERLDEERAFLLAKKRAQSARLERMRVPFPKDIVANSKNDLKDV